MRIPTLTAVILAGGKATRMNGQDKGLVTFKNQPLIWHVKQRIEPQVDTVLINANRHLDVYAQFGRVISDTEPDFQGPLAGMLSGLIHSQTDWVVIVPCDTPFIPLDLVARLQEKVPDNGISFACDGTREHPTHALLAKSVMPALTDYLAAGQRKIRPFFESLNAVSVDFSDCASCFENINTFAERDFWEAQ